MQARLSVLIRDASQKRTSGSPTVTSHTQLPDAIRACGVPARHERLLGQIYCSRWVVWLVSDRTHDEYHRKPGARKYNRRPSASVTGIGLREPL
jgi:hypothetical protein